jgi:hypothetical protein
MITMHRAPDMSHVLGDGDVRYTRTPSYIVPPMIIAALIVAEVLAGGGKEEDVITFNVTDMLEALKAIPCPNCVEG